MDKLVKKKEKEMNSIKINQSIRPSLRNSIEVDIETDLKNQCNKEIK